MKINKKQEDKSNLSSLTTTGSNLDACFFLDSTKWLESDFLFNKNEYNLDSLVGKFPWSPLLVVVSPARGESCSSPLGQLVLVQPLVLLQTIQRSYNCNVPMQTWNWYQTSPKLHIRTYYKA